MVIKKISKIKILVFGSSGQLGSSLKKFYKKNNKLKFYFLSKKKLNINNYKKFLNYVKEIKPVYIINAAAYTNVDLAEQNKKLCFEVNSKSLKKIAKFCDLNNIILIHISTDYVYSGKKQNPYNEKNKTSPLSVYGQSKLSGEKNIINNTKKYFIFRVSGLFSDHKISFVKKITIRGKKNKILNVVNDQFLKPLHVDELSNFIIYLIKNNKKENFNYGIYNFTGKGNKTSWYKIAKIIEETFKKNKIKFAKIRPISTNELNQLAQRPYNALLDNNKFYVNFKFTQNNWKKNLENVLNKILL